MPLRYHREVARHLKTAEPGAWAWFASSDRRAEEAETLRLDLLKSTYRLEAGGHPALFDIADALRETMGMSATFSIYQAHVGEGFNAALAYTPGEVHIIFSGPVLTVLSADELKALLAHELAHFLLFEGWDKEFLIAADLIRGLANDATAGHEYGETLRLWNLFTELFCDRWALRATGDLGAAVRTLVKAQTGLSEVNADSYLRQAAEIFRAGPVKADHSTHPEIFIRARALELWAEQREAADPEIERLIQRPLSIERLDVLAQRKASDLTRCIIESILSPDWLRTEATLAHARQFFPDLKLDGAPENVSSAVGGSDTSFRDYCCYLLLDFATVDRELGDAAVAAALMNARHWGIEERFAELAPKELGLTKKAWAKLEKEAEAIVRQGAKAAAEGAVR